MAKVMKFSDEVSLISDRRPGKFSVNETMLSGDGLHLQLLRT